MMTFHFNGLVSPESAVMDSMRDQINLGSAYYDVGGMTIRQHAWLLAWQASLIRGEGRVTAISAADAALETLEAHRSAKP